MVNVLDCSLGVSEFEPRLQYYVHFWYNALGGCVGHFYPSPIYELIGIMAVLLRSGPQENNISEKVITSSFLI